MGPSSNPIIRALVVVVAVAAGIRLIFILLEPALPALVALLVLVAVIRLATIRGRDRW